MEALECSCTHTSRLGTKAAWELGGADLFHVAVQELWKPWRTDLAVWGTFQALGASQDRATRTGLGEFFSESRTIAASPIACKATWNLESVCWSHPGSSQIGGAFEEGVELWIERLALKADYSRAEGLFCKFKRRLE